MKRSVPHYVSHSVAAPRASRVPWYTSTFPTYAGIFLWVGFYLRLAGPTLSYADGITCVAALLVAGALCFALYYYVPATLGMQTGRPLYVVGTSTFGTTGGYLIPGLLMGCLQVGWVAVGAAVAANFLMKGLNATSTTLFSLIVIVWIYGLGWLAIKGIKYVSRVAKILNFIPFIMILVVFWTNRSGISHYQIPHPDPSTGFINVLMITIGYFATAGAAGADIAMNNRSAKDVVLGGLLGIVAGAVIAGGLPILSVAGYLGRTAGASSYEYTAAIASVGVLSPVMFFLFAAATMVPTCFSSFIAANSFSTMLPSIPRTVSALVAISVSAVLAITGVADNLVGFFSIVGASFSPICGAMAADFILSGGRWSGPRSGINWAGYTAWLLGFLVGIPEAIPGMPAWWVRVDNPSVLYSFAVAVVVYIVLARLGMRPPIVDEPFLQGTPGERS